MTDSRQTHAGQHGRAAWRIAAAALGLLAFVGCEEMPPTAHEPAVAPQSPSGYGRWPDELAALPRGPAQAAAVCARTADDAIHKLFCGVTPPTITSLTQLQDALRLGSGFIKEVSKIAQGDYAGLSVTAHSTALSTRSVSAINPRVIALQTSFPLSLTVMGFTRGEQFVELIASDPQKSLHFYVLGFEQACNLRPGGCTFGDLQTPAIESDWTQTTLYDEANLANTVLDCAPCHQPGGPGTAKFLRMQEFDQPWTHWFSPKFEGGMALLADYVAAKGDETLAGFSAEQILHADPEAITTLVTLSQPSQPNTFHSALIEREIKQSAAALGGNQPFDNSIPGTSPTWTMAYEKALQGTAISVPYHGVKVTDPVKLARVIAAYQAYRRGELSAAELPDIRDVYPDDPMQLAEMGVGTDPRLDGPGVLVQTCSQCHNSQLDQSLTRARFRPDLSAMPRAEKDLAIARLQLPPSDPRAMPPLRLRVMTEEARELAIDALRR